MNGDATRSTGRLNDARASAPHHRRLGIVNAMLVGWAADVALSTHSADLLALLRGFRAYSPARSMP
jgi:hypothetical protein